VARRFRVQYPDAKVIAMKKINFTLLAVSFFVSHQRASAAPTALSLPSFAEALRSPLPSALPASLPAPESPLPLPPAFELEGADLHLDWSFLGGKGSAPDAVRVSPKPKPLAPAGAAARLSFSAEPIVTAEFLTSFFDAARPRAAAAVLP
jgi:hypothetical protein